jgi:hypothetical protein
MNNSSLHLGSPHDDVTACTTSHNHSDWLKSYVIQRTDHVIHPYGTFKQPCYSYDQALSILLERQAKQPQYEWYLEESCQAFWDEQPTYLSELTVDMSKPFHAAWALQIRANRAITIISELDDDSRTAETFHAASEACFRASNILNALAPNFTIQPEAWSNPAKYYAEQGACFFDVAMKMDCDCLDVEGV